jgi:hypothetical protein
MWRETASGDKIIEGMNVQPLAKSLQEINSFQLKGKGIANDYAILVLPLFSIVALILCIRTPMPPKRKILWCLGILVGFGRVGVNWTSGAILVSPLYLQFLSAGWLRWGPFAPHQILVSVPLFPLEAAPRNYPPKARPRFRVRCSPGLWPAPKSTGRCLTSNRWLSARLTSASFFVAGRRWPCE